MRHSNWMYDEALLSIFRVLYSLYHSPDLGTALWPFRFHFSSLLCSFLLVLTVTVWVNLVECSGNYVRFEQSAYRWWRLAILKIKSRQKRHENDVKIKSMKIGSASGYVLFDSRSEKKKKNNSHARSDWWRFNNYVFDFVAICRLKCASQHAPLFPRWNLCFENEEWFKSNSEPLKLLLDISISPREWLDSKLSIELNYFPFDCQIIIEWTLLLYSHWTLRLFQIFLSCVGLW